MTEPVPRSLHEHDFKHLEAMIGALDRILSDRITALDREFAGQLCSIDRRHSELAVERNRAVDAALAAANEKFAMHNNILGAMKDQAAAFVTKEQAAAQFKGLAIALAAIAALATLVATFVALGGQA